MTAGPGRFIWHDLMTTDRDRIIPFYRDLFGWTPQPVDMGPDFGTYVIIHSGDRQVGGYVELDPQGGVVSHWIGYVSVDDVDRAAAAAREAGGRLLMEATDLPSVGRFAIIADPEGALSCPIRADKGRGADPSPPGDGHFCWDGLLTHDPEAAARFYTEVIGWPPRLGDRSGDPFAGALLAGDEEIAGIFATPDNDTRRAVWLPFVRC